MLYWGLKAFCMRVEDVREWLLRVVCCARSRGLILPYCLCPSAGMWSSYAGKVVAVSICCHFPGGSRAFCVVLFSARVSRAVGLPLLSLLDESGGDLDPGRGGDQMC